MPPSLNGVLDAVLADFTSSCLAYYPLLALWAIRILSATSFLGFGIVMVQTARSRDFWSMLDCFFLSLFRIGIVYAVLDHAVEWGSAIIDLGRTVGTDTAGLSPAATTPSGIYTLGDQIVSILFHSRTFMMWIHPIDDVGFCIVLGAVWVTWLAAAVIYLFTLMQCVYVVVIGPIKLSFAALEYTWPMLMVWFEACLSIAIKLMATLLTLAIGMQEANGWVTDFANYGLKINLSPFSYVTLAILEAVIFALAIWSLPVMAHRLVRTHLGSGITWDDAGAGTLFNAGKQTAQTVAKAAFKGAKAGVKLAMKAAA